MINLTSICWIEKEWKQQILENYYFMIIIIIRDMSTKKLIKSCLKQATPTQLVFATQCTIKSLLQLNINSKPLVMNIRSHCRHTDIKLHLHKWFYFCQFPSTPGRENRSRKLGHQTRTWTSSRFFIFKSWYSVSIALTLNSTNYNQ